MSALGAAAGSGCRPCTSTQSAVQDDQRAIVDAKRRSQIGAPLDSCRVAPGRESSRDPGEAVRIGALHAGEDRHGDIGRLHDVVYRKPDEGLSNCWATPDQLA